MWENRSLALPRISVECIPGSINVAKYASQTSGMTRSYANRKTIMGSEPKKVHGLSETCDPETMPGSYKGWL